MESSSSGLNPALFAALIAAIFVVIGGLLLYFARRIKRQAEASKSWPSAAGKITTSWVSVSEDEDSEGRRSTSYRAVVEYDYSVAGQSLHGNRVCFGGMSGGKRAAEETIKRYPVGAPVTVFYDPAKPSQCTLEQTAGGSIALIIIGTAFLIIGPLAALVAFALRD